MAWAPVTDDERKFRPLDDEEEQRYRVWARARPHVGIYAAAATNGQWQMYHPVFRDEWRKMGIFKVDDSYTLAPGGSRAEDTTQPQPQTKDAPMAQALFKVHMIARPTTEQRANGAKDTLVLPETAVMAEGSPQAIAVAVKENAATKLKDIDLSNVDIIVKGA